MPPTRPHRSRRWITISLLIVVALSAIAVPSLRRWLGPRIVVSSPNGGQPEAQRDDGVLTVHLDSHIRTAYLRLPAASAPTRRGTILLLHGIHDRKESLVELGRELARQGFQVVLPDLRGHGGSGGRFLGYGYLEGRDMAALLSHISMPDDEALGVIGFSYGGAAALHLAAREPRVRGVMTVATFTSMEAVVASHMRAHLPMLPISPRRIEALVAEAADLAGFDAALADSRRAAGATEAAILIVHGSADVRIPVAQAHDLAEAAGENARLVVVEGANHDGMLADASGVLHEEMRVWLDAWAP